MKAKLLTLAVAVLLSTAVMAQFHIGAKGGANVTKVDGKSFKDEFRYGYHIGGFMEIRAGKNLLYNRRCSSTSIQQAWTVILKIFTREL